MADARDRAFADERADRDGHVVEHAEALTVGWERMVEAAAEVHHGPVGSPIPLLSDRGQERT